MEKLFKSRGDLFTSFFSCSSVIPVGFISHYNSRKMLFIAFIKEQYYCKHQQGLSQENLVFNAVTRFRLLFKFVMWHVIAMKLVCFLPIRMCIVTRYHEKSFGILMSFNHKCAGTFRLWVGGGGEVGELLVQKKLHNGQMCKHWNWEINARKFQEKQKGLQLADWQQSHRNFSRWIFWQCCRSRTL